MYVNDVIITLVFRPEKIICTKKYLLVKVTMFQIFMKQNPTLYLCYFCNNHKKYLHSLHTSHMCG